LEECGDVKSHDAPNAVNVLIYSKGNIYLLAAIWQTFGLPAFQNAFIFNDNVIGLSNVFTCPGFPFTGYEI